MKVEMLEKCVRIEGGDFEVEVWATGAVRLNYTNERHDETLISEWIPETRKACLWGDPLLTGEDIQEFWRQAFACSWRKSEVTALLRKEFNCDGPVGLRRSEARRVMDMILRMTQGTSCSNEALRRLRMQVRDVHPVFVREALLPVLLSAALAVLPHRVSRQAAARRPDASRRSKAQRLRQLSEEPATDDRLGWPRADVLVRQGATLRRDRC
jgi:hypothetical protein